MNDPRNENARQFTTEGGKVTGVELAYIPVAASKWELIQATLIDEVGAQGTTIARVMVKDKDGIDAQVACYLGWPWKNWQAPAAFENKLLPGNVKYPYEHVISNGYEAPGSQGPLAIYIGDQQGNVMSDVIGGLGLPHKHHVSFHLVFRERSTSGVVPIPVIQPDNNQASEIIVHLKQIEAKLEQLAAHFGLDG
jgi:hypothetical protein